MELQQKQVKMTKLRDRGRGEGGVVVITAAIESWGLMGDGFLRVLGRLEGAWAARHHMVSAEAARTARRWREEAALHKCAVSIDLWSKRSAPVAVSVGYVECVSCALICSVT